jgi:transposase
MDKKRAKKPQDWREARRLRAWELKGKGWSQQAIAEALGVSKAAVSMRMRRGREGGPEALRTQPKSGAPRRLTDEQLERLPGLLKQGAEHFGFRGEVWTRRRVASVIEREFGVRYSLTPVGRILRALRWSSQQPVERAEQRDEAAIERWRTATWPALQKAIQEGRTIVFVDEAGVYQLPAVVRSYAPIGETPVLRVPLTWDHLSVISAVTLAGDLYLMMQEHAFKGPASVRFLKHLLRHLPGKLLVIWDGLPAHHGTAVRAFLTQGGAQRLHLERLPGYAPDLTPDEGIWRYLKQVELRNVCCHDLTQLRYALRKAVARLHHKTDVIQACFSHALGGSFTVLCSAQ